MRKHTILHEWTIPLYRGQLVVLLSNHKKSVKKILPEFDWRGIMYGRALQTGWHGQCGFIIVLNFDNKHREMTHGVIAHEALHIVQYIAEERGFDLTGEAATYLLEWVTDRVHEALKAEDLQI